MEENPGDFMTISIAADLDRSIPSSLPRTIRGYLGQAFSVVRMHLWATWVLPVLDSDNLVTDGRRTAWVVENSQSFGHARGKIREYELCAKGFEGNATLGEELSRVGVVAKVRSVKKKKKKRTKKNHPHGDCAASNRVGTSR